MLVRNILIIIGSLGFIYNRKSIMLLLNNIHSIIMDGKLVSILDMFNISTLIIIPTIIMILLYIFNKNKDIINVNKKYQFNKKGFNIINYSMILPISSNISLNIKLEDILNILSISLLIIIPIIIISLLYILNKNKYDNKNLFNYIIFYINIYYIILWILYILIFIYIYIYKDKLNLLIEYLLKYELLDNDYKIINNTIILSDSTVNTFINNVSNHFRTIVIYSSGIIANIKILKTVNIDLPLDLKFWIIAVNSYLVLRAIEIVDNSYIEESNLSTTNIINEDITENINKSNGNGSNNGGTSTFINSSLDKFDINNRANSGSDIILYDYLPNFLNYLLVTNIFIYIYMFYILIWFIFSIMNFSKLESLNKDKWYNKLIIKYINLYKKSSKWLILFILISVLIFCIINGMILNILITDLSDLAYIHVWNDVTSKK